MQVPGDNLPLYDISKYQNRLTQQKRRAGQIDAPPFPPSRDTRIEPNPRISCYVGGIWSRDLGKSNYVWVAYIIQYATRWFVHLVKLLFYFWHLICRHKKRFHVVFFRFRIESPIFWRTRPPSAGMGGGSPISPLIIIMYTYMYTYARGDGGESISFPPHFFRYSSEGKKRKSIGFLFFPPLPCPPFDQLFPVRGSEKQAVSREKEIRSLRRSQERDRLRLRSGRPHFSIKLYSLVLVAGRN